MNLGEFEQLLTRYLKRNDLTDLYGDWINFTSMRIDEQLRLSEQEYRSVTVPKASFINLPFDFIEMRHIETSTGRGVPLEYLTPTQLTIEKQRFGGGGGLRFYTIMDNQLELVPSPTADSVATLEMFYYARLPKLVEAADTNKVLEAFPNLYLYGAMIEASAFMQNQAGAATYAQMWTDFGKTLNDRQQAARFSGDSIAMRRG